MLDKMPLVGRVGRVVRDNAEPGLQVMRRTAGKLARRIDEIRQKQRLPWRSPLAHMTRWFQRQLNGSVVVMDTQQQIGVIRIRYMMHIGQTDACFL